jgi:hypothetical protein
VHGIASSKYIRINQDNIWRGHLKDHQKKSSAGYGSHQYTALSVHGWIKEGPTLVIKGELGVGG